MRTDILQQSPYYFNFKTPKCDIFVEAYEEDMLLENVDAIVCPDNEKLTHAGGVARLISDAVGNKLNRECQEYVKKHGNLKTTEVMDTSAGNFNPSVKRIIHASGPNKNMYAGDEKGLRKALNDTYYHCVSHANSALRLESITLPAIGAGIFGCPKELVASESYKAVMRCDSEFHKSGERYIKCIRFVNIESGTARIFMETFKSLNSSLSKVMARLKLLLLQKCQ
jgi:O-acetyl-ADP-ribose deacetylase (regulator of RNase III)